MKIKRRFTVQFFYAIYQYTGEKIYVNVFTVLKQRKTDLQIKAILMKTCERGV